jgi:transcriptional regulator with XRE-family HTH domain
MKTRKARTASIQPPKMSPRSSTRTDSLAVALAARIQRERSVRDWSLEEFARRSEVSRAMISKIERAECSPTAIVLSKLSGALSISMSSLLAGAEDHGRRLRRLEEQQVWIDPQTKYVRRSVSPSAGMPLQLVEVELPPNVRIPMPASSYSFLHQQMWVLQGELHFWEGREKHELGPGDCLQLSAPQDCIFVNPSKISKCRYLVALIVK